MSSRRTTQTEKAATADAEKAAKAAAAVRKLELEARREAVRKRELSYREGIETEKRIIPMNKAAFCVEFEKAVKEDSNEGREEGSASAVIQLVENWTDRLASIRSESKSMYGALFANGVLSKLTVGEKAMFDALGKGVPLGDFSAYPAVHRNSNPGNVW